MKDSKEKLVKDLSDSRRESVLGGYSYDDVWMHKLVLRARALKRKETPHSKEGEVRKLRFLWIACFVLAFVFFTMAIWSPWDEVDQLAMQGLLFLFIGGLLAIF